VSAFDTSESTLDLSEKKTGCAHVVDDGQWPCASGACGKHKLPRDRRALSTSCIVERACVVRDAIAVDTSGWLVGSTLRTLPVLPLLQDLLVPAGQTLADCTAKDATQVEQLTAAAAAARANAIIAITGQPVAADAAASRRVAGKQQGVSVSGGGEIEPTESGTITKSLAGVPERCRVWCAGVHSVVVSSHALGCMLLSRAWQPLSCACASLLDG
jgi:hypothetical protein